MGQRGDRVGNLGGLGVPIVRLELREETPWPRAGCRCDGGLPWFTRRLFLKLTGGRGSIAPPAPCSGRGIWISWQTGHQCRARARADHPRRWQRRHGCGGRPLEPVVLVRCDRLAGFDLRLVLNPVFGPDQGYRMGNHRFRAANLQPAESALRAWRRCRPARLGCARRNRPPRVCWWRSPCGRRHHRSSRRGRFRCG